VRDRSAVSPSNSKRKQATQMLAHARARAQFFTLNIYSSSSLTQRSGPHVRVKSAVFLFTQAQSHSGTATHARAWAIFAPASLKQNAPRGRTSRTVVQGFQLQMPLADDPIRQVRKTVSSPPQARYRPDRLNTPVASQDTDGFWKYRITKSGYTNTYKLPNQ